MASSSRDPLPPEDDDEDDPVIMRLPVYLQKEDEGMPVCLFQYPLRPRWRPYNLADLKSARVRPEQKRVEMQLGTECSEGNRDGGRDAGLSNITLASTTVSAKTSYAIGMVRRDESGEPTAVCLTPLSACIQMRPSFSQLDQAEDGGGGGGRRSTDDAAADPAYGSDGGGPSGVGAGGEEEGDGDDDESDGGTSGAALAPVFRAAQTEREIEARRSSYAYLVEQRDAEPWSSATIHPPDAPESVAVRERCFRPPAGPP